MGIRQQNHFIRRRSAARTSEGRVAMAEEKKGVGFLHDRTPPKDLLGFDAYRDAVRDLICDPTTQTPLTIGLFGKWGSGKTSLMEFIQRELDAERAAVEKREREGRKNLTVWFNAWKYEPREALWRALLLQVLDAVRRLVPEKDEPARQKLDDLAASLYREVEREELGNLTVDWRKLLTGAVGTGTQVVLGMVPGLALLNELSKGAAGEAGKAGPGRLLEALGRARATLHKDRVQSIEQFQKEFAGLVQEYIQPHGHLVVFVDDLDRCLPEKGIEVLEAIKLFLDAPGCIFLLGLDRDVVEQGIQVKYKDFVVEEGEGKKRLLVDGANYLEKIIQLPFELPPVEAADMGKFIEGLQVTFPDARCQEVFAQGLEHNPRKVKRTINTFLFLWKLAPRRRLEVTPVRLAKVVVIRHSHPALYKVLEGTPLWLRNLEEYFRRQPERELLQAAAETALAVRQTARAVGVAAERGEEVEAIEGPPPALAPYVGSASLRDLLTMHPLESPEKDDANFAHLTPEDLKPYFTLTRTVLVEAPRKEERPAIPALQLVRVPAGEFLMGTSDEEIEWLLKNTDWAKEWKDKGYFKDEKPQHSVRLDYDYQIGKYPVMCVEYQAFVKETKHPPPSDWEGENYPEGRGDHPVVHVSWDDAMAYCRWLTEKLRATGRLRADEVIRLPTEAEWEKAASWDPANKAKRIYPWGNEFDPAKCNTAEGGKQDTTPVGQYSPAGDSYYGAADMAGNVWEWCQSLYQSYPYRADDGRENVESSGPRVLRGGAWYDYRSYGRCASRYGYLPDSRYGDLGFRVVVSPL